MSASCDQDIPKIGIEQIPVGRLVDPVEIRRVARYVFVVQKLSVRGLTPPPTPSLKEQTIARPRITDPLKKSEAFRVRLTVEEKVLIEAKANKVGLSVSEYVRRCALSRKLPSPSQATDFETRNELRRIGVNMNQMAKTMNSGGIPNPDDHAAVLEQLRTVLDSMMQAVDLD